MKQAQGFRRLAGFLSPDETERWLALVRSEADLFRTVGSKSGLGMAFDLIDGLGIRERLPALAGLAEDRLRRAAEELVGCPMVPIGDPRRALRIQRYRRRAHGFRWHVDGSHTTALLTLANSNGGATEVIPRRWSRLCRPLFYPLYPIREVFSVVPHESIPVRPGELLVLTGSALVHRATTGADGGERVVLLAAFDRAGTKPRPVRDWIARRVNY